MAEKCLGLRRGCLRQGVATTSNLVHRAGKTEVKGASPRKVFPMALALHSDEISLVPARTGSRKYSGDKRDPIQVGQDF